MRPTLQQSASAYLICTDLDTTRERWYLADTGRRQAVQASGL